MSTTDGCLSFKDKQRVFVDTSTSDGQYNNINLNHTNSQSSFKESLCSKSVSSDSKKEVQSYGKEYWLQSFFKIFFMNVNKLKAKYDE